MAIKIGAVSSIGHPDNWSYSPDIRATLVKTLEAPYVAVVGDGHVVQGDTYSFTAIFTKNDFDVIGGYFDSGTLVDVTTESGTTLASRRVIIKSMTPVKLFESNYVQATLELWGA